MLVINLQPLSAVDEVSGDVMIGGQYHTCCCCKSLNTCMTVAMIPTIPQF
jgi:hypothetical protein